MKSGFRFLLGVLIWAYGASFVEAQITYPPDAATEAEMLAIELNDELTAPSDLVTSISNDLQLIRTAFPELADIYYWPRYDPTSMIIGLTPQAMQQHRAGQYHALDELNEMYGVFYIHAFRSGNAMVLYFDRLYNIPLLATIYADAVPGDIRYAEPNWRSGDSSNIEADPPFYTFIRAWGDCPAGCIYQERYRFYVQDSYVCSFDLNRQPVAVQALDAFAFAWIDGIAEVQLDGSGSYDDDCDALEYYWYNEANDLIATGAVTTALFDVGEHDVVLIVNDGVEDSEPNTNMVTVLPAIEMEARLTPKTLNRKSGKPHVTGRMELAGYSAEDFDPGQTMWLMPGNIPADRVELSETGKKNGSLSLKGYFAHAEFMDSFGQNDGKVEVGVAVRLISGQWIYGTDVVRIK